MTGTVTLSTDPDQLRDSVSIDRLSGMPRRPQAASIAEAEN